jgi:hypothetical protein
LGNTSIEAVAELLYQYRWGKNIYGWVGKQKIALSLLWFLPPHIIIYLPS